MDLVSGSPRTMDLYYPLEVHRLTVEHTLDSYAAFVGEFCTGDLTCLGSAKTSDIVLDSLAAAHDVYYAWNSLWTTSLSLRSAGNAADLGVSVDRSRVAPYADLDGLLADYFAAFVPPCVLEWQGWIDSISELFLYDLNGEITGMAAVVAASSDVDYALAVRSCVVRLNNDGVLVSLCLDDGQVDSSLRSLMAPLQLVQLGIALGTTIDVFTEVYAECTDKEFDFMGISYYMIVNTYCRVSAFDRITDIFVKFSEFDPSFVIKHVVSIHDIVLKKLSMKTLLMMTKKQPALRRDSDVTSLSDIFGAIAAFTQR
eukprot:TRINITY_DN20818_c0_g1_i1.p1 TRINITY_DN20818_c0_g1~~TRINITY_DN20818_c0_g1_i1.p1  ORF type:complete len:313 (+),score=53.19 TRINITY_DN20818_c0_g1_i1:216-1154(+)